MHDASIATAQAPNDNTSPPFTSPRLAVPLCSTLGVGVREKGVQANRPNILSRPQPVPLQRNPFRLNPFHHLHAEPTACRLYTCALPQHKASETCLYLHGEDVGLAIAHVLQSSARHLPGLFGWVDKEHRRHGHQYKTSSTGSKQHRKQHRKKLLRLYLPLPSVRKWDARHTSELHDRHHL